MHQCLSYNVDTLDNLPLYFLASLATFDNGPPLKKIGFLITLAAFMGLSTGATAFVTPCATKDPEE